MRLYIRSRTVSHGFSRSCTIAYTILHGHGTRVSFLKVLKNHTRLSRIHSNGPSVTRIRPRLVRLNVRFTRMANRISRVFCVRQALTVVKQSCVLNKLRQSCLCYRYSICTTVTSQHTNGLHVHVK